MEYAYARPCNCPRPRTTVVDASYSHGSTLTVEYGHLHCLLSDVHKLLSNVKTIFGLETRDNVLSRGSLAGERYSRQTSFGAIRQIYSIKADPPVPGSACS